MLSDVTFLDNGGDRWPLQTCLFLVVSRALGWREKFNELIHQWIHWSNIFPLRRKSQGHPVGRRQGRVYLRSEIRLLAAGSIGGVEVETTKHGETNSLRIFGCPENRVELKTRGFSMIFLVETTDFGCPHFRPYARTS